MQDISVGEPAFDRDFVIQGNDEERTRWLLSNPRIRMLLQAQPDVRMTVKDDEGWFAATFPDGVDELHFAAYGVVKDLNRLKGLYDLFAETLNHLAHLDSAYLDDESLHLEALRGPGGVIEHGGTVLWEGESPRVAAAAGLGRLRSRRAAPVLAAVVQQSTEGPLLCTALRALGEIGDLTAAVVIIPHLGAPEPVRGHAAAALRELGRGAQVELFQRILRRGEGDPRELVEQRLAYVRALTRALRSSISMEAGHAAKALRELGAVEALPALREAARTHRSAEYARDVVRTRIDEAIRDLEKRQSLPRPSTTPHQETDDLPLPADASHPPPSDGATLPRASSEPP
jgi:hypothetical protein